jgi:uncharacterized protein
MLFDQGEIMPLHTVWVEIPAINLERAMAFYETVFGLEPLEIIEEDVRRHATLSPGGDGHPGMSINQTANFEPGNKGVLIYLHVGDDSAPLLERVEGVGGKIIEGKTSMGATFYSVSNIELHLFRDQSYVSPNPSCLLAGPIRQCCRIAR